MCQANLPTALGGRGDREKPSDIQSRQARPEDVPLGDGIANIGRLTILTRRERLRAALENAGA